MIKVDETLTQKVAHLARLKLSTEEVKTFTPQLSVVLGYIEKLQEVEVGTTPPLIHPFDFGTPMREDEVVPPQKDENGHPKVLAPAPDLVNDGFRVPSVL